MKKKISFMAKSMAILVICLGMSVNILANETSPVISDETAVIKEKTLESVTTYSVSVKDGMAYVFDENNNKIPANNIEQGTKVTLSLDESMIPQNHDFAGWEVIDNDPNLVNSISLNNPTSKNNCTFYMNSKNVNIVPIYKELHNIEAIGGEVTVYKEIDGIIQSEKTYSAFSGQSVNVNLNASIPEGQCFDKWLVEGGNPVLENERSHYTSFIMPDSDVKLKASFAEGHKINSEQAYLYNQRSNSDSNIALPGDKIDLYGKNFMIPEGDIFQCWEVIKGNVILDDPTSFERCTFIMPDEDVKIIAKFKNNFSVLVSEPGYAQVEDNEQSFALPNSIVKLRFNESCIPEGKVFKRWKVVSDNVQLSNPYSIYDCSFTMPSEDVVIDIEYDKGYKLDVVDGMTYVQTENNSFYDPGYVKPGDKVEIRFDSDSALIPDGKVFDGWKSKNNINLQSNEVYGSWSFIMPEENVVIEPVYVDGHSFTIIDEFGEGDIVSMYKPGSHVKFSVFLKPNNQHKVFKELKVTKGSNVTLQKEFDGFAPAYSFTMPNEDVVVEIIYEDGYEIQLDDNIDANNINDNISHINAAKPGQKILLSYWNQVESNQLFKKFVVKSGNVELINPTSSMNCYFYMPNENIEIGVELEEGKLLKVHNGTYSEKIKNEFPNNQMGYVSPKSEVYVYVDKNSIPAGKYLAGWKVINGLDVTFEKSNSNQTNGYDIYKFVMPNDNLEIEPILKDGVYTLTYDLNGGKIPDYIQETISYDINVKENTYVNLPYLYSVEPPKNMIFKSWLVNGKEYNQGDRILVDGNIVVKVLWELIGEKKLNTVFISNGTPSLNGSNIFTLKEKQGRVISIKAQFGYPEDGFEGWYALEDDVVLNNSTSRTECTFIMPDHPVHIFAKYKDKLTVIYDYNGVETIPFGGGGTPWGNSIDCKFGGYITGMRIDQGLTFKLRGTNSIQHPSNLSLYGWKNNGHIYKPLTNLTVKENSVLYAVWLTDNEIKNVDNFIEMVTSIGDVTLNSIELISKVESLYKDLSNTEKYAIDEVYISSMKEARKQYERLKAVDDKATEDAKYVDQLISSIGIVTSDTVELIEKAREKYDSLSDLAKSKVENLDILLKAESIVDKVIALSNDANNEVDKILKIEKDLVKSSDLAELDKSFKKIKELLYSKHLTQIERNGLELASKKIIELKTIVKNVETSMEYFNTEIQKFDLKHINSSDLESLQNLLLKVDGLLSGNNITTYERDKLENNKKKLINLLDKLYSIEDVIRNSKENIYKYSSLTVNSDDVKAIEESVAKMDEVLKSDNLTKEERAELEASKKAASELLDVVKDVQESLNSDSIDATSKVDSSNVKLEDKKKLEETKTDLENILNSGNLTETEKSSVQNDLDRVQKALETIKKIENVNDLIESGKYDDAQKEMDKLSAYEKSLISKENTDKLKEKAEQNTSVMTSMTQWLSLAGLSAVLGSILSFKKKNKK